MFKYFVIILFILVFLAGLFSYHARLNEGKPTMMADALKAIGLKQSQEKSRNKIDQINLSVDKGMMNVREKIQDLRERQDYLRDAIKDRETILESQREQSSQILQMISNYNETHDQDLLRIKETMARFQDDTQLMIDHGRDMLRTYEEQRNFAQQIAENASLSKINQSATQSTIAERYNTLKEQNDLAMERNREITQSLKEKTEQMRLQMTDFIDRPSGTISTQQQAIKDHMAELMRKQQENMLKINEMQERIKQASDEARQKIKDNQQRLENIVENNRQMQDEAKQRLDDQKVANQLRIEDQMQKIRERSMENR